jgi:hypothetical protein
MVHIGAVETPALTPDNYPDNYRFVVLGGVCGFMAHKITRDKTRQH